MARGQAKLSKNQGFAMQSQWFSTLNNYSFDPSGNVVQRHQAGSTLADFTTLYDGFGQQLGCISTVIASPPVRFSLPE